MINWCAIRTLVKRVFKEDCEFVTVRIDLLDDGLVLHVHDTYLGTALLTTLSYPYLAKSHGNQVTLILEKLLRQLKKEHDANRTN